MAEDLNITLNSSSRRGDECLTQQHTPRETEAPIYVWYGCLSLAGVLLNSLLIIVYQVRKHAVLGDRETFVFLSRLLTTLDLCIALCVPGNLYLVFYSQFNADNIPATVFYNTRTYIIAAELFGLTLVATDRVMAVRAPTSRAWKPTTIKLIFGCTAAGVIIVDTVIRGLAQWAHQLACQIRRIMFIASYFAYGLEALGSLVFVYIAYITVFYSFWRHTTKSAASLRSRQVASINKDIGSPSQPQQSNPQQQQNHRHIRLAVILFCVTVCNTLSFAPIFLFNLGMINFPGYFFYYLFYINPVTNSTIYIATNPAMRAYLASLIIRVKP